MITVRSTINLSSQTVPQIIPVVQGDTGRSILFTLADFTIPQGSTATYYVQKPSGEAVYNAATIDGNTVLVELTAQSIIEAGDNYGQVRIENDGEVVTSFDFILLVKPFRGIDATQSTTEMNIFDKAVEQAEEAIDEAKVEALEEIAEAGSGNIAEAFDAANSYLAGEYTIYQAKLYRFTSNHTGAWTGSDAEELTVGDALTDLEEETTSLKEDLSGIISTNLLSGTSYTENKYVSYNDGILYNSSTTNVSDFIDISHYTKLIYSRLAVPSSSAYIGIAFYDSSKAYISGERCIRSVPTYYYVSQTIDVPEGAVFIRLSVAKNTTIAENPYLYDSASYDESMIGTLIGLSAETEQIKLDIGGVNSSDGWYYLPSSLFVSGDWTSYTGTSSRKYRVKTLNPISFPRNVILLAQEGFYLTVYYEGGGYKDTACCVEIPANTNIKVNVRRIYEDTSETADIEEFSKMLLISSGFSDMEKYRDTFTDVTMFPRIGISGDSYSAGGGIISGITELTWGKNLERESGVTVDIYARSGESIVGWNTDEKRGLPALLAGEECGLYWFAHGINGTSTDEAIGTPEDMSADPKPQTFYGQYVYAIEAVKAAFPEARIVIATIMGTGYSLYQTTYKKVNTAIRNIAEYCSVPVVDLADDDFYKSTWYGSNHLSNHPTAMLNAGIAHANRRILAKCIMDNPSYFINYGNQYD